MESDLPALQMKTGKIMVMYLSVLGTKNSSTRVACACHAHTWAPSSALGYLFTLV